ncbi:hypothetical protein FB471_4321 [Amycolatopsis cihanbeyliensis]|uniref:Uncharacterized protein n=1 Tax=Amycolatopsis cihanbeyliensis TaxID=1128664 RepID=A0A542DN58_AMYCI|nr:hypothetical protein FB471_4321 [Amycolatopsis cihanbeyliensis]
MSDPIKIFDEFHCDVPAMFRAAGIPGDPELESPQFFLW